MLITTLNGLQAKASTVLLKLLFCANTFITGMFYESLYFNNNNLNNCKPKSD